MLGRQCLAQRIDHPARLAHEVEAWEKARNAAQVCIDWQFKTPDARIKLKRLYTVLVPINSTW